MLDPEYEEVIIVCHICGYSYSNETFSGAMTRIFSLKRAGYCARECFFLRIDSYLLSIPITSLDHRNRVK